MPAPETKETTEYPISTAQILALTSALMHPADYVQRCVEHVAFCAHGGQSWTRSLQLRIPRGAAPAPAWQIAPLGHYARRRLPDLVVTDSEGRRLNLLTREQHGVALAKAMLCRHLDSLPRQRYRRLAEPPVREAYASVRARMLDFFTAVGDFPDPEQTVIGLARPYARLLANLGVAPEAAEARIADLVNGIATLLDSTPYLCWVKAHPGEVLNLLVTCTTRDPRHAPTYSGQRRASRSATHGGSTLADRFSDFGIAPIKHEFDIPSHLHADSYYFTIKPPEKTSMMFLDWEVGSSLDPEETVSCSLDGAHLPDDGSDLASTPDGLRVRAFLRVSPHQRAQILAAALLNIILVWLFRDGHAPGHLGSTLQGFVVAAPSGLVAYLVSQQRHYYAYPLRKQRAVLWAYLTISILFLLTVSLSQPSGAPDPPGLALVPTIVAWTLLINSAGVLAWYLPLGFGFNWTVAHVAKERIQREGVRTRQWEVYVAICQQYGTCVALGVLLAMLSTAAGLASSWPGASPSDNPSRQSHAVLVSARPPTYAVRLSRSRQTRGSSEECDTPEPICGRFKGTHRPVDSVEFDPVRWSRRHISGHGILAPQPGPGLSLKAVEQPTFDQLNPAQLTESERRAIERFASRLNEELGGDLRGLWLYGSRARGTAHPESDVDLLVIAEGGRDRYGRIAGDLSEEIAIAEGESPFNYSVHVRDPEWLRDRRAIESFFIQEVDRDKIVLAGSGLA